MRRHRRQARARRPEIDPDHLHLLFDGDPSGCENDFSEITFHHERRELWHEHGGMVMERWIDERPGTRPSCWWLFDAPRADAAFRAPYAGWYFERDLIDGRRQLSGSGRPAYMKYPAVVPQWRCGIPSWMEDVDPDDPPVFEAERDYLARHGLLHPEEK